MVMDVKCAFLHGVCRRRIYIELPRQDPKHGAADLVGLLQKAMYGTRDAPQIWAKEVQQVMEGLGFVLSMFQPSVYYHPSKDLIVVVIARMNCMSQDRPDLSVAARLMSQYMSRPREGIVPVIKRAIRYLKRYPRCCLVVPNNLSENFEIGVWSDSDWASEQATRRSCSGGYIQVNGVTVGHWSKTQLNVALSSGEAELNASVKALSETIGLKLLMEETLNALRVVPVSLHVDASACKGMLLRHGSGRVKHLATKQLSAQGAIEAYSVVVRKIPRGVRTPQIFSHTR